MSICKVEGCESPVRNKGLCNRHYQQMRNHGKIMGNPGKTNRSPNDFIIEKGICRIILCDGLGNVGAEAIIDEKDYEKVKDYKWKLSNGYVINRKNRLYLPHLLLGVRPKRGIGPEIDHKSRNKLDNRKTNLRLVTSSENSCNRGKQSNNSSGYKGVYWFKSAKLWCSEIMIKGKRKRLGYFKSKRDAAEAYNEAALKYHGEFAYLNEMGGTRG